MDCSDLELPDAQLELLKALKETGKTVIAVVICGRPLVLTQVCEIADGVILGFYPGTQRRTGNCRGDLRKSCSLRKTSGFPAAIDRTGSCLLQL